MKDISGVKIIDSFVKNAPSAPGVYRMLSSKHEILYIGKANNLKKRVKSYTIIQKLTPRLQKMVSAVAKVEITITKTEAEALLLEANLIKHNQPKYNIELKDNKSFPYIAIDSSHEYPRIFKHRGEKKKNVTYFGPFSSAGDVNRTIAVLQKSFLIRPCADSVFFNRSRPCLEYQIKRCSAPCVKKINKSDYGQLVDQAIEFLTGKNRNVQSEIEEQMLAASQELDYEKAAILRDRIKALTQIQASQYINPGVVADADVIAINRGSGRVCIQVFFFRAGRALGNKAYFPGKTEDFSDEEILESFIGRFYQINPAPKEIIVGTQLSSSKVMEEAFGGLYKQKIKIIFPLKGEKLRLVEMASDNAEEALERKIKEDSSEKELLEKLSVLFELEEIPQRIEVFDNSHIMGTHAVGGMIVAGVEGFTKNAYRKFNIKGSNNVASGGDDYAMMREVLTRRYSKMKQQDESDKNLWPGLILIDGGPGHLSVANEVFEELGLMHLNYVCISKGPDRNAGREKFYQTGKVPFQLRENDPVLFYLQRLRDEAHRFAITTHRAKRSAAIVKSKLDDIAGVGAAKKRALLHHFGSAVAVERASIEEIEKVDGISKKLAKSIYEQLR